MKFVRLKADSFGPRCECGVLCRSHEEVEFVAYCVFTYVLEVGEELMMFSWEEM